MLAATLVAWFPQAGGRQRLLYGVRTGSKAIDLAASLSRHVPAAVHSKRQTVVKATGFAALAVKYLCPLACSLAGSRVDNQLRRRTRRPERVRMD
jgi:hypothetical protein